VDAARIRSIPLFAGLSPDEAERIAALADECEMAPGTTVMSQGEFGHALFAVEQGTGDVLIDGAVVGTGAPPSVVATSPMRRSRC
jgi:hypothetical protein